MATTPNDPNALREWHRLFGLLLTDFFIGSPFTVEVERDLSRQQQFLYVVIVRRGPGRFDGQLPDGLDDLAAHNLITFKSHRETLDGWAMKELVGHNVAYRKVVSSTPSELLPEDRFRLYAVCARFPQSLSALIPWQELTPGVYDCKWGTDVVRVIVAGQLPLDAHNAPLHLFSASAELVGYGSNHIRRRSGDTSQLLERLFGREDFTMAYTMENFRRDYMKEHLPELTLEEQKDVLEALPPERRLAGLSADQIRKYLEKLTADTSPQPRKPRRKKK